jgi:AcrR family transcriptional regulator
MRSLPRGRHGLSREFIAADQQRRVIAATTELLGESGLERATVAAISARAGISKSDFYVHFASKDSCFLAAYDEAVERVRGDVRAASVGREWAQAVCAGLEAALAGLAARPAQASLLLVEGLRAGPLVSGRFQAAVDRFGRYLRDGAPLPPDAPAPAVAADVAIVGGIASLLGSRVLAGEAERLDRFFPDIAEFALAPYVGVAAARRIIFVG